MSSGLVRRVGKLGAVSSESPGGEDGGVYTGERGTEGLGTNVREGDDDSDGGGTFRGET
jgi:hypothetical protein